LPKQPSKHFRPLVSSWSAVLDACPSDGASITQRLADIRPIALR
jgi:hypothetical protein